MLLLLLLMCGLPLCLAHPAQLAGLDHLKSWENPVHSYAACGIVIALAFRTTLTLVCVTVWLMKGKCTFKFET